MTLDPKPQPAPARLSLRNPEEPAVVPRGPVASAGEQVACPCRTASTPWGLEAGERKTWVPSPTLPLVCPHELTNVCGPLSPSPPPPHAPSPPRAGDGRAVLGSQDETEPCLRGSANSRSLGRRLWRLARVAPVVVLFSREPRMQRAGGTCEGGWVGGWVDEQMNDGGCQHADCQALGLPHPCKIPIRALLLAA